MTSLPVPCRKANRSLRVSLRVEEWPAADQSLWSALFTTGDLFDEVGLGAHLSRSYRTALANVYGRWLGFLVRTEPSALAEPLHTRVTRERIMAFAYHLAETNIGRSVADQLRALRGALRLMTPAEDWTWLLTIAKRIEAHAQRRSKRDRLRTSDELFTLGLHLMEQGELMVEESGRVTKEAALTYRDGLLIALLAAAPIRRGSLASLAVGHNVLRVGGGWLLALKASEMKNKRPLDLLLPSRLGKTVDRYLERFRPALFGSAGHSGLWASAKGAPLTGAALYQAVCKRTKAAFGRPVNPHLFRDGAATFWALKAPGQVRAAGALLGHADPRTTERYYNQANAIMAGRKLADAISRQAGQRLKQ
jgi:integrase